MSKIPWTRPWTNRPLRHQLQSILGRCRHCRFPHCNAHSCCWWPQHCRFVLSIWNKTNCHCYTHGVCPTRQTLVVVVGVWTQSLDAEMLFLVVLESSSSLLVAWRGRHLRYATLDHSWIPVSLRAAFSCVDFEHDASAWLLLRLLWWFEWSRCAKKERKERRKGTHKSK